MSSLLRAWNGVWQASRHTTMKCSSRAMSTSAVPFRYSRKHVLLAGAAVAAFGVSATFALPRVHLDAEVPTSLFGSASPEKTVDPASGIEFPNVLRVTTKVPTPLLSLVGVGIRTVSFLGIKVYSVGFYADLNNPNLKFTPDMTPEQRIAHIVQNSACVLRIVPTRTTSYVHLRDSFVRALSTRTANAAKQGTLSEEEAIEAGSPIRKVKTIFPNSPFAKHQPLDVFLPPPTPGRPRALIFRDLGAIENDFIATELFLHYFDGDGPSPPMKKAVVEKISQL